MYAAAFISLFFFVTVVMVDHMRIIGRDDQASVYSQAVATNLILYRNAVVEYARANQAYTGAVPDGNLSLPTWYRNPGWVNYVAGGMIYVYPGNSDTIRAGLASALIESSNANLMAGIAQNGTIFHSGIGDTGIAVPVGVTNGTPIFAGHI